MAGSAHRVGRWALACARGIGIPGTYLGKTSGNRKPLSHLAIPCVPTLLHSKTVLAAEPMMTVGLAVSAKEFLKSKLATSETRQVRIQRHGFSEIRSAVVQEQLRGLEREEFEEWVCEDLPGLFGCGLGGRTLADIQRQVMRRTGDGSQKDACSFFLSRHLLEMCSSHTCTTRSDPMGNLILLDSRAHLTSDWLQIWSNKLRSRACCSSGASIKNR